MRVSRKFTEELSGIVAAWTADHQLNSDEVCWDASMDFLPGVDPEGSALIPAIGVYLEIPGPTMDQVVSSAFYFVPFLPDWNEFREIVTGTLDNLLAKKTEIENSISPI